MSDVREGAHPGTEAGGEPTTEPSGAPVVEPTVEPVVEPVTEAAATRAELAVAPEIVASSLGEYFRGWIARIKAGESGVLPVIVGLIVIAVIFQTQNSNFLTAGNLVNLIVQGAPFMLLGLAQVYALLLGEIDLSIGFVGGVAGAIVALLLAFPHNWPWWGAVGVTVLKIAAVAVAGIALTLICNANRGLLVPIQGMPWVVLIVLGVLGAWSLLLGKTRFGRYVYAIGGNAEAARRAGVNLARIRTTAFILCSLTAGIAGVVYASRLRSVSTNLGGGTLVLYAGAPAPICRPR